jgi:hypothetical protein
MKDKGGKKKKLERMQVPFQVLRMFSSKVIPAFAKEMISDYFFSGYIGVKIRKYIFY